MATTRWPKPCVTCNDVILNTLHTQSNFSVLFGDSWTAIFPADLGKVIKYIEKSIQETNSISPKQQN